MSSKVNALRLSALYNLSSYREPNCFSTSKLVSRCLWNPEVYSRVYQRPPYVNPIYALIGCFFQVYFNNILPPTHMFPALLFKFSEEDYVNFIVSSMRATCPPA